VVSESGEPVARGAVFIAAGRGVALICSFALQVAMARMLGVEKYGLFGFIISLLAWMEIVYWGFNRVVSMEVARRPRSARSWERSFAKFQLLIALFLLAAGVVLSLFIPAVIGREGSTPYFMLAFLDIPFLSLYCLYLGLLNGMRAYRFQALSFSSYYAARFLFCFLLVALGLSLHGAILGNILCSLAGLGVGFLFFRRLAPETDEPGAPGPARIALISFPFVVLPLAFNLTLNINLWLVGAMGTEKDLGLYNAAFSISRISFVLLSGLTAALFPAASAFIHDRDLPRSRRLVEQGFRFLLIILTPIIVYGTVASREVMTVFGEAYRAGAAYLALLLCAFGLASLLYFLNYIQMAGNRYRLVLSCNMFSLLLEIALTFLLVPRLGMAGVALALLLSLAAVILPLYLHARDFFGPFIAGKRLGTILAAAAFSSFPLFFSRSLPSLLLLLPPSLALYLISLSFLGELTPAETRYWLRIISGKSTPPR
jgi:O-antigen/teichoic acid export membrane protein